MEKLEELSENGSLNFETLVRMIGSTVLDSSDYEGRLELLAVRDEDRLTLMLLMNIRHTGEVNIFYDSLRRISVGEGISVQVKGADEISVIQFPVRPYGISNEVGSIWSPPVCRALRTIRVVGSATVVAYGSRRHDSYINTIFPSKNSVELLPKKCYIQRKYPKAWFLENALEYYSDKYRPSDKAHRNIALSAKTRIRPSAVFRFQFKVERYLRRNNSYWSTMRPIVECSWFEIDARIKADGLYLATIKKLRSSAECRDS